MLPASEGWRPLHRLSPFLTSGRLLAVGIFGVYQSQLWSEPEAASLLVSAIGVGALILGWFSWRATGYRITEDQFESRSGILFRSHSQLPLARLETVDIARPLIARVFGLVELRVEVVSSKETDVRLRYMSNDDALALRDRLLHRQVDSGSVAAPIEGIIARTSTSDLLAAYLLGRLALMSLIFAFGAMLATLTAPEAGIAVFFGGFGPIVIAVLTLLVTVERLYGFTLSMGQKGLVIHRGLLNQLRQEVALNRVQAVRIEEPFLWRFFGRARITVDIAGYRGSRADDASQTSMLLPIGSMSTVDTVLQVVYPGLDRRAPELLPTASRAKWRKPIAFRTYAIEWTPGFATVCSGLLRRRTDIIPHSKVQSLRIIQGPWQRRLDLATLHLDTAGKNVHAVALHRDAQEAHELALQSRSYDS